jgi:hypothetical protein
MVTTNDQMPRIGTARMESRPTLGGYIRHVGSLMGYEFHPWQQYLSDVSCEMIPRANRLDPKQSELRMNYQYVGAMVGRQSGKSAWCASRIVAQCLMPSFEKVANTVGLDKISAQHVAYTSQSRNNAISRWREHVDIIAQSSIANQIKNATYATGREVLEFTNGSTYRPITPNRTGARGFSLDLVIVDEALAHPLWLLGVLRPTMAQRDNAMHSVGAQFVVVSNAGDDDSELLNRMQELGHESIGKEDTKRMWAEWSADPEADPFDEQTWHDTIPTLNQPNGIDIDFIRLEAETMPESQFIREYLCVRSVATNDQIIPFDLWMEANRGDIQVPMDRVVLGLDIRMDRQGASLVACGPVDFYLPIEVIEAKQGLDWVLDRTVEVARRWSAPIALDVGGPAATIIPALEAAGVTIIPLAAREVTLAAATLYDAVFAKRIAHMNDFRLNDAVIGASRRAVGERWAFDRRGHKDISPLVAASFAMWAVDSDVIGKPTIYG